MTKREPTEPHIAVEEGLELGAGLKDRILEHASRCPECAAKVKADGLLMAFLEAPPESLPPGFAARICDKAVRGDAPAPLWWVALPLSWRLGLAALLVVAAFGGWSFGSRARKPARLASAPPACCEAPELAAMRMEGLPTSLGDRR